MHYYYDFFGCVFKMTECVFNKNVFLFQKQFKCFLQEALIMCFLQETLQMILHNSVEFLLKIDSKIAFTKNTFNYFNILPIVKSLEFLLKIDSKIAFTKNTFSYFSILPNKPMKFLKLLLSGTWTCTNVPRGVY